MFFNMCETFFIFRQSLRINIVIEVKFKVWKQVCDDSYVLHCALCAKDIMLSKEIEV